MTDTKRILPWKKRDFGRGYEVTTRIADFSVLPHAGWFVAWVSTGISRKRLGSFFDTFELAMDACEADYIARCTEFLKLAGPGECVVKVEDAKLCQDQIRCRQSDLLVEQPVSEMVWAELEFTTGLLNRLSAAIDAARRKHEHRD